MDFIFKETILENLKKRILYAELYVSKHIPSDVCKTFMLASYTCTDEIQEVIKILSKVYTLEITHKNGMVHIGVEKWKGFGESDRATTEKNHDKRWKEYENIN